MSASVTSTYRDKSICPVTIMHVVTFVSASEMTCIVSSGALNSTHLLLPLPHFLGFLLVFMQQLIYSVHINILIVFCF